jgi:hypothetical protein
MMGMRMPETCWAVAVGRSRADPTTTNSTAITKLQPEAATAVVVASDDEREDAKNMLGCI